MKPNFRTKREFTLTFLGVYEDGVTDEESHAVVRCCLPSGHTRTIRLTDDALVLLIEQATEIMARRHRRKAQCAKELIP